jgi:polysaccharide export outer membrane protein
MEAVRVSEEYSISLPLVNNVNLRGKTAREAELLIRDAYDRDFLVNPQVSVNVVKYSDRSVNVIGQVNKPDRVLFPQEKGLTIIEAIALAGGQTRLADLKKVKLTRKQPNGETEVQEIDVDALMKRGGRDAIQLQKDDVIFIPERII